MMEQSGRVIIFDSEEDAEACFAVLQEFIRKAKIEWARMDMESWKKRMRDSAIEPNE